MSATQAFPAGGDEGKALAPSAFLRIDRAELQDGSFVIRAVATSLRAQRRLGPQAPLAYLYERPQADEPETDLVVAAGHYDQAASVWSFSGEVSGIIGLTEPLSPAAETPGRPEGG